MGYLFFFQHLTLISSVAPLGPSVMWQTLAAGAELQRQEKFPTVMLL